MKRFFVLLLLLMSIVTVSSSFAEGQGEVSRKRYPSYLREVVRIDREAQTITVRSKKTTEVFLTGEAKFAEGYSLGAIKPGDRISIRYVKRNGNLVATGISPGPLMNVEAPPSGSTRGEDTEKAAHGVDVGSGAAPEGVKSLIEEPQELSKDGAADTKKRLKKTQASKKAKVKASPKKTTPSKKKGTSPEREAGSR